MAIAKGRLAALWWLPSLLLAFPATVMAASFLEDAGFSGFGTVGLLHGGDEVLGNRRDISGDGVFDNDWSVKPDSLLGLQVDVPLTGKLDAAVQLVVKDRPSNTLDESLEWAFLRYRPTPELMLRGGRLGLDLFMLSEYRNLGFSYLWARPPVEFYGLLPYNYYDGADIAYVTTLDEGVLRARLFAGSTQGTISFFSSDVDVDVDPLVGATLGWESDRWQARLGFATMNQKTSNPGVRQLAAILRQVAGLWPEAVDIANDLDAKGSRLYYYSAGFAYDPKPWTVQSEISYIDSGFNNAFSSVWSAYLSLGRRMGPVTVYGLGAMTENPDGRVQAPSAPLPLAELQQQAQVAYDLSFIKQHSLSLGMRWDIRYDLALKLQWDRTWVDDYGGLLWQQKQPLMDGDSLDTFSINLNFLF
jgi:hypothetical protein